MIYEGNPATTVAPADWPEPVNSLWVREGNFAPGAYSAESSVGPQPVVEAKIFRYADVPGFRGPGGDRDPADPRLVLATDIHPIRPRLLVWGCFPSISGTTSVQRRQVDARPGTHDDHQAGGVRGNR